MKDSDPVKHLESKKFLRLDAMGAILSAFILGVVLVRLEWFLGIPKSALYFLASIPVFYMIYDLFCYFKVNGNWGKYLRIIAIANILYTCISVSVAFYHREVITMYGWIYIAAEVLVILGIVIFELKVANRDLGGIT